MEFRESTEDRHFRQEVREWLNANKPKTRRPHDGGPAQKAYDRAWQRAQYDGGWAGIAWPKEYGGKGLSPAQQLIWCEEYAAAHCPGVHDSCWLGLNHAGPTLMVRGTEAQKAFHLPKILNAESAWCQGFSEPNAGSDLTALRARGVVDGDHLVVNGQKIWTTYGHHADYQELLVRTGTEESRHRGLTWAICDMSYPGVEVRPIESLDGEPHCCEVFYDNVRIPLSNVVGEIDGGWSVAITTLGFERGPASFAGLCEALVVLEDIVEAARSPSLLTGRPAIASDDIAHRIAMARAWAQSLRALMYRMVAGAERGQEPGPEGSIMRLSYTEFQQVISRLALDILGPESLSRPEQWYFLGYYFHSFAETIAGGTAEIQRSTIGERLLGLPR